MTPKEQAKELVDKFMNCNNMIFLTEGAKECALIAVETVILNCYEEEEYYWREVKQEIERL